jgi:putative hydrolase of the HAD superfamily
VKPANAVLLLDFDHTLYPSTLSTLKAVDARINLYLQTFLGFTAAGADAARVELWDAYGTTLKGLEELHGVDRGHYCDFIHAIEESHLPPPDPELEAWLARVPHPCYIFTNARMDWAVRGLKAMGLAALLPEGAAPHRLRGIFDIAFMDWEGKPNRGAYAKVDAYVRARHGDDARIHFADDRPDNLESAREQGWTTIWIHPHTAGPVTGSEFDRVAPSLLRLDPESLA